MIYKDLESIDLKLDNYFSASSDCNSILINKFKNEYIIESKKNEFLLIPAKPMFTINIKFEKINEKDNFISTQVHTSLRMKLGLMVFVLYFCISILFNKELGSLFSFSAFGMFGSIVLYKFYINEGKNELNRILLSLSL